ETAGRQPDGLTDLLQGAIGKAKRIDRAFIVQLTQRLRDQDPEVWPALEWIEQQLAAESLSTEQIVHVEHQRQAAAQTTVGNIITSMRLLSTLDWEDFFERVSQVDPILAGDPIGAYSLMDFATRDRYRHIIEKLARRTKISEQEIAQRAVSLASKSMTSAPHDRRRSHVGYYLVDRGCRLLEQELHYRGRWGERILKSILRHPTTAYLGTLAVMTTLILVSFLLYAHFEGASVFGLIAIGVLLIVPISDFSLSALNLDVTVLFKPLRLPKMNTAAGVPEIGRTFVVIPTIFSSEENVQALIETLEVHFLANRDDNIFFALLGDFVDAAEENTPDDDRVLEAAHQGIQQLNVRYSGFGNERFHLFHRRRKW